jgi:hypothetical protein
MRSAYDGTDGLNIFHAFKKVMLKGFVGKNCTRGFEYANFAPYISNCINCPASIFSTHKNNPMFEGCRLERLVNSPLDPLTEVALRRNALILELAKNLIRNDKITEDNNCPAGFVPVRFSPH